MNLGIVGLPNVGKSTLFNALTKGKGAMVANYPFCTIEPNVGVVEVPDERLAKLADIEKPEKIIPAIVEFVDIAGLVKGASEGEGLGNKFLSNIRNCDAIVHVVRVFENKDIVHVSEVIDPKSDIEVIHTELILADLEMAQKRLPELEKKARTEKESAAKASVVKKILEALGQGKLASSLMFSEEEQRLIEDLHLITAKKILFAANCSEEQIKTLARQDLHEKLGLPPEAKIIPVCAQIEDELNSLPPEEAKIFLDDLGLKESTLNSLIREAYDILGLQTYFTAGPKEVRAWTIRQGWKAPKAASVIHTDFEKGFIRAEVCFWKDFVDLGGEGKCREVGKLRVEGKEYVMRDGDTVHFLFSP